MAYKYKITSHVIVCVVFEWLPYVISTPAAGCNMSHIPQCPSSSEGEANKLDCFRLIGSHTKHQCVWEPGESLNISRFKLLVEKDWLNKTRCKEHRITGTSVPIGKVSESAKERKLKAYVVENGMNCTLATFEGSPANMIRCRADVELQRRSGQLFVKASWDEGNDIQKYFVKYREYSINNLNDSWTTELSQHKRDHTIKNLNSSMLYEVQVQCLNTSKCTQCAPSRVFTVPQELTRAPVVKCNMDGFHQGRRKVTISWESPSSLGVAQHNVRVQKVSWELNETFVTQSSDSTMSLLLSHSAYRVSLNSRNNVSESPKTPCAIEPALEDMRIEGALKATFNSNHSFNLSWNSSLTNAYECYTVEWFLKGDNATAFESFYSNTKQRTIDIKKETPFLPYKRYIFLLHVKPFKETCELKQLNSSDITCGWTEAYLLEGTPVSDPRNVSHSNVTDSSVVITWLPILEDELQGFLQGYMLYLFNGGTKSNITLGPEISSYKLTGLKSGSDYHVEMAAFTSRGEGKRSSPLYFGTNPSDTEPSGWILVGSVLTGVVMLLVAVHLCIRLTDRVKEALWPSIPNPSNSSAIQKIDREYELEPMVLMNGPIVQEHWDSGPLYLMDSRKENKKNTASNPLLGKQSCDASGQGFDNKDTVTPSSGMEKQETGPSTDLTAIEVDSTPPECGSTEFGKTDIKDIPCQRTKVAIAATAATALAGCDARPAVAFMSDYTTMELFQQATIAIQAECHPCQPVSSMPTCFPPAGLDYIHQSQLYTPESWTDETHGTANEQASVL
ncbi:interleukin-6 receptor subunit beta [Alosa alosa]|uniref:interleukin-6 receptor subunit beta n=1 Tax=Alosa alosa TaxID=278164 RepID=UPI00201529C0|nr:interleukin-6 receptor subunit beta [Alosa alosa]